MNNFPFFRFPYNNYYRYYNYRNNFSRNINHLNHDEERNSTTCPLSGDNRNTENYIEQNNNFINNSSKITNSKNNNNKLIKDKSSKFHLGPIVFDSSSFSDSEKPILELLGLKLYLDDILIISLLYFLYEEDVKDETLFISLILLLLS